MPIYRNAKARLDAATQAARSHENFPHQPGATTVAAGIAGAAKSGPVQSAQMFAIDAQARSPDPTDPAAALAMGAAHAAADTDTAHRMVDEWKEAQANPHVVAHPVSGLAAYEASKLIDRVKQSDAGVRVSAALGNLNSDPHVVHQPVAGTVAKAIAAGTNAVNERVDHTLEGLRYCDQESFDAD